MVSEEAGEEINHSIGLAAMTEKVLGIDPLKVKHINMMHPAARKRLFRSIEYIKSKIDDAQL